MQHLPKVELADHPGLILLDCEGVGRGRQRDLSVGRPGQHNEIVDDVIGEPQQIRVELAFPNPGALVGSVTPTPSNGWVSGLW